jgi:pyrroloquinoline quinone biosynthesis protein E
MLLRKRLALVPRLLHPARAMQLLRLRRGTRRRPEVPDYEPLVIDLEPTVRCNLRCPMCQVPGWDRAAPDLDRAGLERVLTAFPGLLKVKLQGMGEPTLNRELPDLVARLRAQGIYVQTTTNGTLLDRRGVPLLESGIDQVYVSLDGATAGVQEAIRPGLSFDRLLENIRTIVAHRGRRRSPLLEAWCVGQAANASSLPELVRLVRELGLDQLTVQCDLSDWGKEEFRDRRQERQPAAALAAGLERAAVVAREVRLPFAVHHGNSFDLSRGERCPWPWYSTYVSVEGRISPCCFLGDPDLLELGDLRETRSFATIWRADAYRDFRRAHLAGQPPEVCRQCYRNLPPAP